MEKSLGTGWAQKQKAALEGCLESEISVIFQQVGWWAMQGSNLRPLHS